MGYTASNNQVAVKCLEYIYNWYLDLYKDAYIYAKDPVPYIAPTVSTETKAIYMDADTMYIVIPGMMKIMGGPINAIVGLYDLGDYCGMNLYAATALNADLNAWIMTIRSAILKYKPAKIRITSISFGGCMSYSFAYLLSRLISLARGSTSKNIVDCTNDMYNENIQYVIGLIKAGDNSDYINQIRTMLAGADPSQALAAVKQLDKQIFSSIQIDGVYTFGSPSFLTYDNCNTYDNGADSGIDLKSITYSYGLTNDPLFNAFGFRTDLGFMLYIVYGLFTFKFNRRAIAGHYLHVPNGSPWKFWSMQHAAGDYLNVMRQQVATAFDQYNYQTFPIQWLGYLHIITFFWWLTFAYPTLSVLYASGLTLVWLAAPVLLVGALAVVGYGLVKLSKFAFPLVSSAAYGLQKVAQSFMRR